MINQLILEFRRNNEDKKLFTFYTLVTIPIIFIVQISKNYLIIKIVIAMLLIGLTIYLYICKKIKIKIFSKNIFFIFKNVSTYIEHKNNSYRIFIINYLKRNNIYNKSKILFIIESIRGRKEPKISRDWLTFALTVVLTILVAAISNGKIDFKIFENLVIQIMAIVIICLTFYFLVLHGIKDIYKTTFSKQSTLELLDDILSDIYLEIEK